MHVHICVRKIFFDQPLHYTAEAKSHSGVGEHSIYLLGHLHVHVRIYG